MACEKGRGGAPERARAGRSAAEARHEGEWRRPAPVGEGGKRESSPVGELGIYKTGPYSARLMASRSCPI